MSSPEEVDAQFSSSPPLQSAQTPADQLYAEDEELDLASDYLSDVLSDRNPSSQQSSQTVSNPGDDLGANPSSAEYEHQDLLDEESQDSTSVPPRPNKFRGPPSTWRNWTAPERDLAASLDQLQAKDLSVHLYNSFKLRQKNRTRDPGRRAEIPEKSEKAIERSKWIPPKVWTAWPLLPDIVPREHDERRWEEDVLPSKLVHAKSERPGRYLQEMLVAQVLRKAKERFQDRLSGAAQYPANSTKRSQGRQRDSKGRFGAKENDDFPDRKPVIMADDHRASAILQPTVQHMMTKLDDLLVGLHHARSAYLAVEDSGSESRSQATERSTSRVRPQKRKREALKSDQDEEARHKASNHPSSEPDQDRPSRKQSGSQRKGQHARTSSRRSRSQNFHGRKGRLGLRDWSDVLGVASMTGWNQNVVRNATARCATLFREGIKFRTLKEGQKAQEEHPYLPNAPPLAPLEKNQNNTWRAREGSSNRFEGGMVGGVHVDGFLKPIEGKKSWMYSNNKQSKRRNPSNKSRG